MNVGGKCLEIIPKLILQAAFTGILLCPILAHAAHFVYVPNAFQNTVSVIDVSNKKIAATIPVGTFPLGLAITPDGTILYVGNSQSNSVSVVSTASKAVVANVPVGTAPQGLSITPSGAFVYVANAGSGTISVISTATNTVTATIPVNPAPEGIAFTPDGTFAYVATASNRIVVIATNTNTIAATIPLTGELYGAYSIAITPDGAYAYAGMTNGNVVAVIATATNTVVDMISVGPYPLGVAFTPDGAFAYVPDNQSNTVSVIATANHSIVSSIPVQGAPALVAITPDGAFAYVTGMGGGGPFSVISTETNTVVATVSGIYGGYVAFSPIPAPISVSPNPVSGLSNTLELKYSDPNGAADLSVIEVDFGAPGGLANSCVVKYAAATNLLYLLNDAGTGASSITPGSGMLSNSQCTISGVGTSVVKSGNDFTLNLDVTASSSFTGKHRVFLLAENSSEKSAWFDKGTWTPAPNQPPTVVSVTPNTASSPSSTFALAYSDPNGATDLQVVEVDFGSSVSAAHSCLVRFLPATNVLYLLNDAGTGASAITPGSGTVSNSQCTIDGSGTTVVRSGVNLTLSLDVTASSTYIGQQNIFMRAVDNSGVKTKWVSKGTWTP